VLQGFDFLKIKDIRNNFHFLEYYPTRFQLIFGTLQMLLCRVKNSAVGMYNSPIQGKYSLSTTRTWYFIPVPAWRIKNTNQIVIIL